MTPPAKSPKDRDVHVSKHESSPSLKTGHTPIAGVPSVLEGRVPTPVDMSVAEPAGEPVTSTLLRRSAETKNSTLDALKMLEDHRKETRIDIREVHAKVDDVNAKVDGVISSVNKLSVDVASQSVQNKTIIEKIDELKAHRERSEQVSAAFKIAKAEVDKTLQMAEAEVDKTLRVADAEIEKARAITEISAADKDRDAKREIRKAFWVKVAIGIGGAITALGVSALSRCG